MGKKAQIWVETVIYTLIGLSIIGILLGILKPAVEDKQDQLLLEQSLEIINTIDSQIQEVKYYGIGNARPVEFKIKRGELSINSENDIIEFSMESRHKYSQLNESIEIGRVISTTTEKGKNYLVSFKIDYSSNINITYKDTEQEGVFHPASIPYRVIIKNKNLEGGKTVIDFSEV